MNALAKLLLSRQSRFNYHCIEKLRKAMLLDKMLKSGSACLNNEILRLTGAQEYCDYDFIQLKQCVEVVEGELLV